MTARLASVMAQDWLGGLAVASRAIAFLGSIFVDRKPGRVNPEFDEVADTGVFLQDWMRNLEVLGVLGVHSSAVD